MTTYPFPPADESTDADGFAYNETLLDRVEFDDALATPRGSLENLSQDEIDKLLDSGQGGLYPPLRLGRAQCR